MNKAVKKYLEDLQLTFPSYTKDEKQFYKRLKSNIETETSNYDFTYCDCIERFGDPKDIVIDFYEEMDSDHLLNRLRKIDIIKKGVFVFITCTLVLSLFLFILIYIEYCHAKESRIDHVDEIIEIIE